MDNVVVVEMILTRFLAFATVADHLDGAAGYKAATGRLLGCWVDLYIEVAQAVVRDSEGPGLDEGRDLFFFPL